MNANRRFRQILPVPFLLATFFLSGQTGLMGQETADIAVRERVVKFSGEIRYRFEADGRRVAEDGGDRFGDFHLLRTRAGIFFSPTDDVEGVMVIQDSRTFGEEQSTMDGSADRLDVHQAFVRLPDLLGSGLDLQIGRQEMIYGNERLIGAVGWSNVGRSFDAIRLRTADDWGSVDLFASRLGFGIETDSLERLDDLFSTNLYGLWSSLNFGGNHKGDVFALYDNDTRALPRGEDSGSQARNRITAGTFVRGSIAPFDYEGEFAWQGGRGFEGGDGLPLSSYGAFLVAGKLLYTVDRFGIGALYARLSGDDDPTDDTFGAFNTLFATNHKFYGYMDYFPGGNGTAGLQDVGVTTRLKFSDDVSAALDGHLFTTAVDQGGGTGLGKEIDATFVWKYHTQNNRSHATFTFGASVFLADELMRSVVGGDLGWWGYGMMTVNL